MANKAKKTEELDDCKPNGYEQTYDKFASMNESKKREYLTTKVYDYLNSDMGDAFQKSWLHEQIIKMISDKIHQLIDIMIQGEDNERQFFVDINNDNFEEQFHYLFCLAQYSVLSLIDEFEDDSDLINDIKFFFKKDKKLFSVVAITIMKNYSKNNYNI